MDYRLRVEAARAAHFLRFICNRCLGTMRFSSELMMIMKLMNCQLRNYLREGESIATVVETRRIGGRRD
jgi:hypothetical protein